MIIHLFSLSLLLNVQPNTADKPILLAQARASEVLLVEKLAKRCGSKSVEVFYVRGAELYHHPVDAGAELAIYPGDLTQATRECLRRGLPKLRQRLKTAYLESDAL